MACPSWTVCHVDNYSKLVKQCQQLIKRVHNVVGWNKWYIVPSPVVNPSHLVVDTNIINSMVKSCRNILEEFIDGIKIDDNVPATGTTNSNCCIELHQCNSSNQEQSEFAIHTDNDNNENGEKFYTIIVYFDARCSDGELAFYSDETEESFVEKVDVKSTYKGFSKCIMIPGDVYHQPLPASGIRCALSVQFQIV